MTFFSSTIRFKVFTKKIPCAKVRNFTKPRASFWGTIENSNPFIRKGSDKSGVWEIIDPNNELIFNDLG
jgi:hypothetical protein